MLRFIQFAWIVFDICLISFHPPKNRKQERRKSYLQFLSVFWGALSHCGYHSTEMQYNSIWLINDKCVERGKYSLALLNIRCECGIVCMWNVIAWASSDSISIWSAFPSAWTEWKSNRMEWRSGRNDSQNQLFFIFRPNDLFLFHICVRVCLRLSWSFDCSFVWCSFFYCCCIYFPQSHLSNVYGL